LRYLKIAALVLAAGCTVSDGIAPQPSRAKVKQVYLYQHTLNVLMSDGSLCAATRPTSAGASWSGRLSGCVHELPFTVVQAARVNPLRLVLDEAGLSPILNPIAKVTVTEASGRDVTFVSPPPEEPAN